MKLKDIALYILREQPEPEDGNLENPEIGQDEPQGDGENQPEDGEEQPQDGSQNEPLKPKKEKKLSPIDLIKSQWIEQNPHLNDTMMDEAINFFNNRKNNLRPFVDPNSVPNVRNMPEIFAFKQRFPDFPAENIQKLKDLQNYTWEQIEFLMDRFNTTEAAGEVDFSIEGDTPEDRERSAREKWNKSHNKIIDEGGLVVFKCEGKDESIAFGRLQHILVAKYGGNRWCVTIPPGEGSNLYVGYRQASGDRHLGKSRRTFYFIKDETKDVSDPYYIAALQAVNMETAPDEGPFVITPRPNGDQYKKSWEDVTRIWPQLMGKENLIRPLPLSQKEKFDGILDKIRFYPIPKNPPAADDFAIQSRAIQEMFVDSPTRVINDPRSFMSLSEDLQKKYVANTNLDNYKKKYKNLDESKPFGMLEALGPKLLKFLDDAVLKYQLKIKDGIFAIKQSILQANYKVSFTDVDNDAIKMFMGKSNEKYGIMDLSSIEWIKPLEYIRTKSTTYFSPQSRELFILQRYQSESSDDYFYWMFPQKNLTSKDKSSVQHLRGRYLSKEQGDEIPNQYKKLG